MGLDANEKAAVAGLRWEPGKKCSAPCKPVDDYEFGDKWCPRCNGVFGCGDHDEIAPDMHLPENLWRALQNIARRKRPGIQINTVYDSDTWVAALFDTIEGVLEPVPFFADGTLSGVVFAALVALYDADHPEKLSG
jgi:hypothetical protein